MLLIIPLTRGVQHSIKTRKPLTNVGKDLQKRLPEVISRRLAILERNLICGISTFLDSKFKETGFGLQNNADNINKAIVNELSTIFSLANKPQLKKMLLQKLKN